MSLFDDLLDDPNWEWGAKPQVQIPLTREMLDELRLKMDEVEQERANQPRVELVTYGRLYRIMEGLE